MIKKKRDIRFGRAGFYVCVEKFLLLCLSCKSCRKLIFFFIGPGMPAALLFGISVIPSEIPIESTCALYFPASQGL